MRAVVRANFGAMGRPVSFFASVLLHVAAVVWIVFGPPPDPQPRQRIYDMLIRPQEKHIVWYRVRDRLPDVRPSQAAARPDRRPLRAAKKFEQRMVAGPQDDPRAPRLVWAPAPESAAPKPQPLPNVLAVAPRPLVKPFTPPVPKPRLPQAPALPDAPSVTAKLGAAEDVGPRLKPLVKRFVAPERKPPAPAAAALPDAPAVAAKLGAAEDVGPKLKPLVKAFTPPARNTAPAPEPALPDAPPSAAQLAIVSPDPALAVDIPAPPPPSPAAFSAGPKPAVSGAAADDAPSAVTVPGITVRGGARDPQPTLVPRLGPLSMKTLLAGVRPAPPGAPAPRAAHVSSAPDPMLDGREVYSIAIQMPNITSYSGSWLVWFAEHETMPGAPPPGEIRPPVPLRKVDPKYVAAAAAEGIEGIVRLGAVIGRDGRVDGIRLLRHLDDRLDASAMEALAKWEFEPALRNGTPLAVDAVFEIPFRLAPKTPK
jgi:TonB family protein